MKTKDDIFISILENANFSGWSQETLQQTQDQLGITEGDILVHFPDSIRDMIRYLPEWADQQLLGRWEREEIESMKVREKITNGVRWRLEALVPYKEAVKAAIPHMGTDRTRQFFKTMDLIWRLAGDQSTDFNYYTKRALLSGVYTSTVLFWLQDHSDNNTETWEFLDRRIVDALKLPQQLSSFLPPFLRKRA